MNLLFAAHLIADFLLQPKRLVELKEKRISGIILHVSIHGLVMALLIWPRSFTAIAVILLITILHGAIDQMKISLSNKDNLALPYFFTDQLAHFSVLLATALLFPLRTAAFWRTEVGIGMLCLTIFFSFVLAWWNLANVPKYTPSNAQQKIRLFLTLAVTFLLFIIPMLTLMS